MSRHVLVVEDEVAILRGVLRSINREPRLRATGCYTVDEAVKVLSTDPPELLLTDLNLPGRNGLEMMTELERAGLLIPIIVMTAHRAAFEPHFPKHRELTVLEKPVPTATLLKLIHDKLEESQTSPIGPTFLVADYLQLAAMGSYSVVLRISLGDRGEGWLEIVEGNIWNAFYGELSGEDAVAALLTEPANAVATQVMTELPRSRQIERGTNNLLLDLARIQDEAKRSAGHDQAPSPTPSPTQVYTEAFEEGMAAVREEQWDQAAAAFRRALEVLPGDGRAQHNLERIERLRRPAPQQG